MAKRSKKIQIRAEKEAEFQKKLHEDARGIRRNAGSGYADGLSVPRIRVLKIILLACMPVVFFLYSVLLLPLVLAYGLLYFPSKNKENALNYGMRKELCITVPKADSAVAIGLIVVSIIIIGITFLTAGTTGSKYAGKNEAQVYAMLVEGGMRDADAQQRAKDITKSGQTMTAAERAGYQCMTLLTGQRVLFQTVNEEAWTLGKKTVIKKPVGGGNGPPEGGVGSGTLKVKDKDGSVKTYTGEEADAIIAARNAAGLGAVPLATTITQIFRIISSGFFALTFLIGVAVVFMPRKDKLDKLQKSSA